MYAHILAAILLIPVGIMTMMRGSDGLNLGKYGPGVAGTLTISGAIMVLGSIGLLLGAAATGVFAEIALLVATVVALRQRQRSGEVRSLASAAAGRGALFAAVALLLALGWM